MSKSALVDAVAIRLGGSKADAAKAVDAVAESLADFVGGGGKVSLPPLGFFSLKHRAARKGSNVRTGEPMTIAARDTIHLKPSKKA